MCASIAAGETSTRGGPVAHRLKCKGLADPPQHSRKELAPWFPTSLFFGHDELVEHHSLRRPAHERCHATSGVPPSSKNTWPPAARVAVAVDLSPQGAGDGRLARLLGFPARLPGRPLAASSLFQKTPTSTSLKLWTCAKGVINRLSLALT